MAGIFRDVKEKNSASGENSVLNLRGERLPAKKPGIKKNAALQTKIPQQKTRITVNQTEKSPVAANLLVFASLGVLIIIALNMTAIAKNGILLKDSVSAAAAKGFQKLVSGAKLALQDDTGGALQFFEQARQDFEKTEKEIWFLSQEDEFFKTQTLAFRSGNAVVAAGKHLSEAALTFTKSAKNLKPLPYIFMEAHKNLPTFSLMAPKEKSSITETLKKEIPNITFALEKTAKAAKELETVDATLLPRHLQDQFTFARGLLSSLKERVDDLQKSIPGILALLGDLEPHRFLVLLQNNGEARPTGGFIGSYMLFEMNDGYLTKNEIHDVYQTDYQLKEVIPPPEEIAVLTKQWFLRDSNYSAHFPLSGEKAAWFLQKEDGPSVDSVIAMDQSVIADLLALTGPVYVPSLENFLTQENFNLLLSYIVELKLENFGGKEDPKQILKDFIPLFEKAVFSKADVASIANVLKKAASEKHIMAYSRLPEVQRFFETAEIDGGMSALKPTDDYLQVVNISIGGNKSDSYIKDTFTHDTFFMSDGSIEDELTIEKLHSWNLEEDRKWKQILGSFGFNDIPEFIKEILGRGKNAVFTRIYVPKGSVLLDSQGAKAETKEDIETGKTYFFAKLETEHGKTTTLKIRYRLPFTLDFDPVNQYRLITQKQMGSSGAKFIKRVLPSFRTQNLRFLPASGLFDENGNLTYQTDLKTDKSFASLWRRR